MNHNFGIGVGTKVVTFAYELVAKLSIVIDFTVVGDPHGTIFVAHRHVAVGGKIENGQAAAAEADVGTIGEFALPQPEVIGSAMRLYLRHAGQHVATAPVCESRDAAHQA